MPLRWDLTDVKDSEELYEEAGFDKVPPYQVGILADEEVHWFPENGSHRPATDDEIKAAREGGDPVYCRMYRLNGTTETLIFVSIPVGIPKITEDTVDEFFRRVQEIEKGGALMNTSEGPVFFTEEDVARHTGLKTNVSPVTKRTFDARMRRMEKERAERKQT